jgi:hypothetical protein
MTITFTETSQSPDVVSHHGLCYGSRKPHCDAPECCAAVQLESRVRKRARGDANMPENVVFSHIAVTIRPGGVTSHPVAVTVTRNACDSLWSRASVVQSRAAQLSHQRDHEDLCCDREPRCRVKAAGAPLCTSQHKIVDTDAIDSDPGPSQPLRLPPEAAN